jgi:tripartite-type tricarboxylate transporter receptor subunit TctC
MTPRIVCALIAALPLFAHVQANAQAYPSRSIRLVVPYAPGSTTDTLGRVVGQKLTEALGQQVVIDNRAGAGGNIGTDIVAKATPDGHTLVVVPGSHAINPSLYRKLPFDAVKDFTPIALLGSAPLLIGAHPSLPAATMKDLLALAKAKPGSIRYASGGSGSPSHLSMELLKTMAGIDLVHVPYKGGGSVLTALVSGEVQLTPTGLLVLGPLARAGRIKLLATTGPKRLGAMPELPTVAESGVPGYAVTGWWGVLAPAGLPRPIIQRLNSVIVRALETQELRDRLSADGIETAGGTPEAFADHLKREVDLWAKVVRASGARAE